MKERFWIAYYWLMISYLVLALVTIVDSKRTETFHPYELTCEEMIFPLDDCEPREKPASVSNAFQFFNNVLFFDFIENQFFTIEGLERRVINYYPFILVFLMTLIRFIFIGKHIWQRP